MRLAEKYIFNLLQGYCGIRKQNTRIWVYVCLGFSFEKKKLNVLSDEEGKSRRKTEVLENPLA